MKKSNLTMIIIISGVAAAICMLMNAFLPGVFKSLSTTVFMFTMLAIAMILSDNKKMDIKGAAMLFAVLVVVGLVSMLYAKLALPLFIRIPVFATLAACGALLVKHQENALSAAVFAGAASVYCAGNVVTFVLLSLAYVVLTAAVNERKYKSSWYKIASAVLVVLALCAFK